MDRPPPPAHDTCKSIDIDAVPEISALRNRSGELGHAQGIHSAYSRRQLQNIAKGLEVHRARTKQKSLGLTAARVQCMSTEDLSGVIRDLCEDPATATIARIILRTNPYVHPA